MVPNYPREGTLTYSQNPRNPRRKVCAGQTGFGHDVAQAQPMLIKNFQGKNKLFSINLKIQYVEPTRFLRTLVEYQQIWSSSLREIIILKFSTKFDYCAQATFVSQAPKSPHRLNTIGISWLCHTTSCSVTEGLSALNLSSKSDLSLWVSPTWHVISIG